MDRSPQGELLIAATSGPAIIPRQGVVPAALPERISAPVSAPAIPAARAEAPMPRGPKGTDPLRKLGGFLLAGSTAQGPTKVCTCPKATAGGLQWLPDAVPDCSHLSNRCAGTAQPAAVNSAFAKQRALGDGRRSGSGPWPDPFMGQRRGKSLVQRTGTSPLQATRFGTRPTCLI
jgi:hypothetical protein